MTMRKNSFLSSLPETNSRSQTPFLRSLGQSDWFDSLSSLSSSPSSKRDVIRPYSSSLSSSEHIGRSRSLVRWFQLQRQPQRQRQPLHRSFSTETDNRTAADGGGNGTGLNNSDDIVADASDILLLEKAAFTAKHVEYGVVQSMETAIWKASSPADRRKMGPLLLPRLRSATEGLLNVTADVESLSRSIEEIRAKRGRNAAAESSLRELHRAFLNLAQVLLDHLEASTAVSNARDDEGDPSAADPTQLLEVALALSRRAHRLGLAYHWPLYQRLAIAVAKHPAIVDRKLPGSMAVALGALTNVSRAEWIQTIHGWSKTAWGGGGGGGDGKGIRDHFVFQTDESDLKWFHPSLKALAVGAQWSDVWYILTGLLRPPPQTRKEGEDHRHNRNGGFHSTESTKRSDRHPDCRDPLVTASQTNDDDSNNSRNDQGMNHLDRGVDNDDVVLSSPMILSYMDEELVLDILGPMNQQGLLNDLWNIGGAYPPPKSVEEACDIILLMEASIWKIFGGIPSRVKAGISKNNASMDQTEKYSLQDAIKILLKFEPTKWNQSNHQSNTAYIDAGEAGEYFLDDHGKDSLTQALRDLEDLLDEHLGSEEDEDSEHDGNTTQQASEAIALASVLTNQMHLDDSAGNHDNNSDDFGTVSNADPQKPSDTGTMEVRVKRSGTEHVVEMTELDDKSRHFEDRRKSFEDENNYLDFIYGDRAADYKDNIPDVISQLYEANGGKQLRYSSSLEHHIYAGMQQRLDYYSEDEDDLPHF